MKQPNQPKADSPRIIVDDLKTKQSLISIGEKTGETIKEIVVRLVEDEEGRMSK